MATRLWAHSLHVLTQARYGIRTPQEESETSPFDVTIFEDPGRELYEILPAYIPAGLSMPCVRRYSPRSIECIRPLSQFSIDADEAALTNQKLMHLHIVRAKDLTAICIAWRHVVMDATAMGHVIAHWELLLGRIETHLPSDAEQGPEIKRMTKAKHDSMADFIDTRSGSTTTELAGWSPLSWWQIPLIIGQAILDRQFYPVTFGAAYIPKTLLEKWVSSARIELGEGVRVSRNDIIAAWFYKVSQQNLTFLQEMHIARWTDQYSPSYLDYMFHLRIRNNSHTLPSCKHARETRCPPCECYWKCCSSCRQP